MAQDSVIAFIHDLVGDRKFNEQIHSVQPTPEAWVNAAEAKGYVFSTEELLAVSEELAQKPLDRASVIRELLGALGDGQHDGGSDGAYAFSTQGIARLKAVMQQGRYSGYYRPW